MQVCKSFWRVLYKKTQSQRHFSEFFWRYGFQVVNFSAGLNWWHYHFWCICYRAFKGISHRKWSKALRRTASGIAFSNTAETWWLHVVHKFSVQPSAHWFLLVMDKLLQDTEIKRSFWMGSHVHILKKNQQWILCHF